MSILAAACLALVPQSARTPVQVSEGLGPASLATSEELSLALAFDAGSAGLTVCTSDGRGVVWSPQIPVDGAPPQAFFQWWSALADGEAGVLAWVDDRLGGSEAFVRAYDGAAGVLGPEVRVPTGLLPGSANVSADADIARSGAELRVHVALIVTWMPHGGPTQHQVLLATSTDGGASFAPPVPVTPPAATGGKWLDHIEVEAEGDLVYVGWDLGDAFSRATYVQRSSDGGQTFDFASPAVFGFDQKVALMRMKAVGTTLALALWSSVIDFPISYQTAWVSTDAGVSFHGVSLVLPPSGWPISWDPDVAVSGDGGTVVAAWEESSSGQPELYFVRTSDGGATWSSPAPLTPNGGRYVSLAAAGPGRERVVATWRDLSSGRPVAALSYDGGATFGGPVELDQQPTYPFALVPVAYNDRYQNVHATWVANDAPSSRYVGGLRPQYVEPQGFTAGSTSIGAALGGFDDGSPLVFVLFSSAAGDLPLPFGDGRNLGLAPAPLFLTSLNLALAGPFAAVLAPDGSAALAPIAVPPLPSVTLHAAALALDLGTLAFGDVSDVVELGL